MRYKKLRVLFTLYTLRKTYLCSH